MRDIKFRAWIKNQNRMIGPLSIHELHPHWSFPLHWGELMQYTGLKDKNGKEIYEGDIVRCGDDSFVAEIYFAEKALCWSAQTYHRGVKNEIMTLGRYIFSREKAVRDKVEVIGNIHETPELLDK